MLNPPYPYRLPYKDNDDSPYTINSDEEENFKDENEDAEGQAWVESWKIKLGFDSLDFGSIRKGPCSPNREIKK